MRYLIVKFSVYVVMLLSLLIIFGVLTQAWAGADVTLQWDPNTESDLAGYRLYESQTSGSYDFNNVLEEIPAGTETVTIRVEIDGVYYYVLTAFDTHGLESNPSNEVILDLDTTKPAAPGMLRIKSIMKD